MRSIAAICLSLSFAGAVAASPADDFARSLKGPWGQVGADWRPLVGALSKNSCPMGGVKRKENIGLFGEGGAMWIEPALAGSINIYEGSPAPRLLAFVAMDGPTAAIYRDNGADRRLSLESNERLAMAHAPVVEGVPSTNYGRCSIKK
jgi:hypothetical protein